MSFDIGSVVATIKADASQFTQSLGKAQTEVKSFTGKLDGLSSNLTSLGVKLTAVSAIAGIGLTAFLKSSADEAINLQRAMVTLDIISEKFGVSADQAKDSAKTLGKELRIGVGSSAASLQNLLKAGLSLDQATDLMRRFTNEAITGKSANISLSQAVENLSFAYATNNSALGNLSGINENFQDITERGRQALIDEGVAVNDITDEMAKYRGMIDLTNLTLGSSEKFTGTLIDRQAVLNQKTTELKVTFGELLMPVLEKLVEILIRLVEWINGLTETQQKWILIIGAVVLSIGPLLVILGVLVSGISAVITIVGALGTALMFLMANPIGLLIIAIGLLYLAWKTNFLGIQDQVKALVELVNMKFNQMVDFLRSVGGRIKDAIVSPFEQAYNKVKEIANKIKDLADLTKRHSPSTIDIIERGVYLANKAFSKLEVPTITGISASSGQVSSGMAQSGSNYGNIVINLDGAIVGDIRGASEIAEKIGDSIIQKLQGNIRF